MLFDKITRLLLKATLGEKIFWVGPEIKKAKDGKRGEIRQLRSYYEHYVFKIFCIEVKSRHRQSKLVYGLEVKDDRGNPIIIFSTDADAANNICVTRQDIVAFSQSIVAASKKETVDLVRTLES